MAMTGHMVLMVGSPAHTQLSELPEFPEGGWVTSVFKKILGC